MFEFVSCAAGNQPIILLPASHFHLTIAQLMKERTEIFLSVLNSMEVEIKINIDILE